MSSKIRQSVSKELSRNRLAPWIFHVGVMREVSWLCLKINWMMRPRRILTAVFRDATLLSQKNQITVASGFDDCKRCVRKMEINVFPFPGGPDIQSRPDRAVLQV